MHGIVGPIVSAVNPTLTALFEANNGFTQAPDHSQKPFYATPVPIPAQVQELTSKDLEKIDGLNLQQNAVAIYLYGISNGVVRVQQKGGDRITIPAGATAGVYSVAVVLEQWPDWVKVAATLQNIDIPGGLPTTGPALGVGPP